MQPLRSRAVSNRSSIPALRSRNARSQRNGSNRILTIAAGAAAPLAGAALFVQLRARRAEAENPPVGRFIRVDGVRLHYVERGEGQPLVLLHGNGALVQDFATSGLVELAARQYRVITFDRPGYGYSSRPRSLIWTPEAQAALFRKAFERLRIERPIVLGHSWGTQVAVALGLDHPNSVKSLVLLSGYYYPTVRADVALLSPPAVPGIGDLMRLTVSPLIGRLIWPLLMGKLFGPNPVPEHFEQFPKWMVLRPGQIRAAAAEAALMIPAAARLSRRYRELRVPAVVLAGEGDLVATTERQSVRLHRDLPGSKLRVLPGVGHMVHHIDPESVLIAIDDAARMAMGPDDDRSGDQLQPDDSRQDQPDAGEPQRRGRLAEKVEA
jgi:pimeloyl-ACP methyl ester carboxylesterase